MKEIIVSKKVLQHRLNTLKIKSEGLKLRNYGVSVKYYSGNDSKPSKRIDYEVSAGLKISNGNGILEINKKNIFYNQHGPDLISEIISDAVSTSIFPIETTINERGLSTNEILNHPEIISRWMQNKKVLTDKYQSETLEVFLDAAENKINSRQQLEKSLHSDWFWNLFFHPKFINYGEYRQVETNLLLSVIPYQHPIRFPGIQKIEKIPTDYHSFVIRFESHELSAPKYFYPRNSGEIDNLYMSLQVEYDLDIYHHFPMHTRATFEVYSRKSDGTELLSSKIEFTMYQIDSTEYQNKTLSDDSAFITGGLVKLPPNKWGFDNFENLENNW